MSYCTIGTRTEVAMYSTKEAATRAPLWNMQQSLFLVSPIWHLWNMQRSIFLFSPIWHGKWHCSHKACAPMAASEQRQWRPLSYLYTKF